MTQLTSSKSKQGKQEQGEQKKKRVKKPNFSLKHDNSKQTKVKFSNNL